MTPKEARERADAILAAFASGDDPESAHAAQDDFYVEVLHAIVEANPFSWVRVMAEQALRVADAPGERWYA